MPTKAVSSTLLNAVYLEVDGKAYPLVACALPDIDWEVIERQTGPSNGKLTIGGLRLGELVLRFAPGLMPPLAAWADEIVGERASPVELNVVRADANNTVQERIGLKECILTELRFPACSAADKSVYFVEAVFRPAIIAVVPGGGKLAPAAPGRQKKWVVANFAVSVGGLPSSRVAKVAAFTVKRSLGKEDIGEMRFPARLAGAGRCTPLSVEVRGPDYAAWRDFALQQAGSGVLGKEIEASLELRDSSMKTILASFAFRLAGLSAFHFGPADAATASDALQSASASFAVQAFSFKSAG